MGREKYTRTPDGRTHFTPLLRLLRFPFFFSPIVCESSACVCKRCYSLSWHFDCIFFSSDTAMSGSSDATDDYVKNDIGSGYILRSHAHARIRMDTIDRERPPKKNQKTKKKQKIFFYHFDQTQNGKAMSTRSNNEKWAGNG